MPPDETINICLSKTFADNQFVSNSDQPQLATKKSFFIFNTISYKHLDEVAMGSPLVSTLAYSFYAIMRKDSQISAQKNSNQCFADEMWMIFVYFSKRKKKHFKLSLNYFNWCHKFSLFDSSSSCSITTISVNNEKVIWTVSFHYLTVLTQGKSSI